MDLETLRALHRDLGQRRILDLFSADPDRADKFRADCGDMRLDYSKTLIDAEVRKALVDLCDMAALADRREDMFAGQRINVTEGRAVLHTALRNLDGGTVRVDGVDVMPGVQETRGRMRGFAQAVRSGQICGAGGSITDVVNIGIGGSDLGPAMTTRALSPYHDGPRCHFVSNVDGAQIADTLRGLNPARTLVIVASKSFTTVETMTNASTARRWNVKCQFTRN